MRWSLPISVLMHVAILLGAIIVLPRPDAFRVRPQEALPVEIVDITDVSKRVTMRKAAPKKPARKPAPPKPEKKAEPIKKPTPKPAREISRPEPKPQPQPEPVKQARKEPPPQPKAPPKPSPDAEALRKLAERAAKPETREAEKTKRAKAKTSQTKPAPRPRVRPREIRKLAALRRERKQKPPTPKRKTTDPIDEIAALLNKVDEKKAAPPAESDRTGTPMRGPADVNGDDARLMADLVDALRSRIEQCWNVPAGVRDARGLRVKVRFQLGPGGEVTGGPVVLNRIDHPAFEAAAGSAVRAVLACQPYDFLPPDRYDLWRDVILNFDPAHMLATN